MYKRYHAKFKTSIVTIFAGELYVSSAKEVLSTVLGSCISVCLYDRENMIGGLNHFMLPESKKNDSRGNEGDIELSGDTLIEDSMRYGITAMEKLIATMQKEGAERKNLAAKIFGGGNVLTRKNAAPSIGDKNIGFTRAYLKSEGIEIVSEDIGNHYGRKIFFLTENNSVFVKRVALEPAEAEERAYMDKLLRMKALKEEVTLF